MQACPPDPNYGPDPGYVQDPGYSPQTTVTSVIVNQPLTSSAPAGFGYAQGLRGWSTGLCGCAEDVSSCEYKTISFV